MQHRDSYRVASTLYITSCGDSSRAAAIAVDDYQTVGISLNISLTCGMPHVLTSNHLEPLAYVLCCTHRACECVCITLSACGFRCTVRIMDVMCWQLRRERHKAQKVTREAAVFEPLLLQNLHLRLPLPLHLLKHSPPSTWVLHMCHAT